MKTLEVCSASPPDVEDTLRAPSMQSTHALFVRCVYPNDDKMPDTFSDDVVSRQLRCGGLLEALRILKLGFPTRYAPLLGA
jgi:myosin heavy subunit